MTFPCLPCKQFTSIYFRIFRTGPATFGQSTISKGNTRFANASRIEPEANKLFRQLAQENHLIGLPRAQLLARLAHYFGELNVIHPFRDGNGRAQRLMFEVIGINAGFALRWAPIGHAEWVEANIAAYNCRLEPLVELLNRALTPF